MAFRDGPFENIKVPLVWTAAVTVVVAAIGCGRVLEHPRWMKGVLDSAL